MVTDCDSDNFFLTSSLLMLDFFLTTSLISKELNIITINQEWMNEGCQKKIGYVIALSLVSLNIIKIVQTKYWIIPYLRRGWGGLNLDTTIPTFLFPITGGGGGVKRGRTIFTIFAVFFFEGFPYFQNIHPWYIGAGMQVSAAPSLWMKLAGNQEKYCTVCTLQSAVSR